MLKSIQSVMFTYDPIPDSDAFALPQKVEGTGTVLKNNCSPLCLPRTLSHPLPFNDCRMYLGLWMGLTGATVPSINLESISFFLTGFVVPHRVTGIANVLKCLYSPLC